MSTADIVIRCDRCGGPVDGFHREVIGNDPDLGWTQRVYCRACVAELPDVGLRSDPA